MNMRQHRKARQHIQRRRANLRTRFRIFMPMANALRISLESLAMNHQTINYSSARQHLMFEESTRFELEEYQREMIDKLIQDRIKNPPPRFEVKRVDYENGDLDKLRIVQPLPVIKPNTGGVSKIVIDDESFFAIGPDPQAVAEYRVNDMVERTYINPWK